jgi:hypothetical protein
MITDSESSGCSLFTAMFSDEPVPDVEAAVVVAHPGDECANASWLLVRLGDRASVFCLTNTPHLATDAMLIRDMRRTTATIEAAGLAGVPSSRCYNLDLPEAELARDLETLVWLTTAAVTTLQPRLLITHACEGENLDHDAAAFAVHMTARLLARCGGLAPLVVEFPARRTPAAKDSACANMQQSVHVELGPESRKLKRRMLRCHTDVIDPFLLGSEAYVLAKQGNPAERLQDENGVYSDAPWCRISAFRDQARRVAAGFNHAILSSPSRV